MNLSKLPIRMVCVLLLNDHVALKEASESQNYWILRISKHAKSIAVNLSDMIAKSYVPTQKFSESDLKLFTLLADELEVANNALQLLLFELDEEKYQEAEEITGMKGEWLEGDTQLEVEEIKRKEL